MVPQPACFVNPPACRRVYESEVNLRAVLGKLDQDAERKGTRGWGTCQWPKEPQGGVTDGF